jgi:hypothetical protein
VHIRGQATVKATGHIGVLADMEMILTHGVIAIGNVYRMLPGSYTQLAEMHLNIMETLPIGCGEHL